MIFSPASERHQSPATSSPGGGHSRRPGGFDAGGSLVCRETLIWSAGEKELAWHYQGVFPPDGPGVTKEFIFFEARRALDRLPKVSLPKGIGSGFGFVPLCGKDFTVPAFSAITFGNQSK